MRARRTTSLHSLLKAIANGVALALTVPLWGAVKFQQVATGGESCFAAGSELLSLVPGKSGVYVRRAFYRICLEDCAPDCHIGFGTTMAHSHVRILDRVYIGSRCTVGRVVIEEDVAIGSNVDILSGRHQHSFDDPDRPILEQGGSFQQIRIGRNSWIGNSAVIMADVGPGCIIGAGSVVVNPIPPGSIAVGNPASVKKQRLPDKTTSTT